MPKSSGFDFLRKFDRYADPIQLTYHERKKFPTPCGGILSLISAAIIFVWLGENIFHTIDWHVTTQSRLIDLQPKDFTYPFHSIPNEKLIVAARLKSMNETFVTLHNNGDMDDYWQILFTATYFNESKEERIAYFTNGYNTVARSLPCIEDDTLIQAAPELGFGYKCIDWNETGIQNKSISLQGILGSNQQLEAHYISVRVVTCEDASNYTGRTTCKTRNESLELADEVLIETLTFSQIESVHEAQNASLRNNSYQRTYYQTALDPLQVIMQNVAVKYFEVTTELNWFASALNTVVDSFYIPDKSYISYYAYPKNLTGITDQIDKGHFVLKIAMSADYEQVVCTRVSLLAMLSTFGGLMYTIKNIGNACNKKGADFALDNDLMRRLYSVETGESETLKKIQQKKATHNFLQDTQADFNDSLNKEDYDAHYKLSGLQEFVKNRMSFYYSYKQYCRRKLGRCFCCCCCLCFSRHATVEDRIFDKTQARLHAEIDLLNIVRQLRISNLLVQMNLQQHQVSLVRWFRSYCVREKTDIYDVAAQKPGQMFFYNNKNCRKGEDNHREEVEISKKLVEKLQKEKGADHMKRLLVGDDLLDFSEKMEVLRDIEIHFNPADDPTDLSVLKQILGFEQNGEEDYDEARVQEVQDNLKDFIALRKKKLIEQTRMKFDRAAGISHNNQNNPINSNDSDLTPPLIQGNAPSIGQAFSSAESGEDNHQIQ